MRLHVCCVQGRNGVDGLDGEKGDKGDIGPQGLKGSKVCVKRSEVCVFSGDLSGHMEPSCWK